MCKTLINFWQSKTKWEDGVSDFLANTVFQLDKEKTPSNGEVDEHFAVSARGKCSVVRSAPMVEYDDEYQAGLESKWSALESGLAYSQDLPTNSCHSAVYHRLKPSFGALVRFLGYTLAFVCLVFLFALSQVALKVLKWA